MSSLLGHGVNDCGDSVDGDGDGDGGVGGDGMSGVGDGGVGSASGSGDGDGVNGDSRVWKWSVFEGRGESESVTEQI